MSQPIVRYLYGDKTKPFNPYENCYECGFMAWVLSVESESGYCEVCDLRGYLRDAATERDHARPVAIDAEVLWRARHGQYACLCCGSTEGRDTSDSLR